MVKLKQSIKLLSMYNAIIAMDLLYLQRHILAMINFWSSMTWNFPINIHWHDLAHETMAQTS